MTQLPTIALTMGDPAGVGPEVILKALADPSLAGMAHWVVLGDRRVMEMAQEITGLGLGSAELRAVDDGVDAASFEFGKLDARCGAAAVEFVRVATEMCLRGEAEAMVTAPLNKEAVTLERDGRFPGIPSTSRNCAARPSRACCWRASGCARSM